MEPALAAAPPKPDDGRNWGRYVAGAVFLAPALFVLGVWVVYPVVYTVLRSFFGQSGYLGTWVGLDNYKRLFTTSTLRTAIKNNAIWVAVVPAFVTSIGLLFAVMLEKIRWKVAFKTVVFLPMAISAFATGVTWRIMYQQDPNLGAVNALTRSVKDVFNQPGVLSQAFPSTSGLQQASPGGAMVLQRPLTPGSVALLGLTGIAPADVPKTAVQAVQPPAKPGTIVGTVWRDFKPGGGKVGVVEKGELGLPGVTVELRSAAGKTVQSTTSQPDGSFAFSGVSSGHLPGGDRRADLREAVCGLRLARAEADHPRAPDRLHLDLGRVLDGRGRGRVGGDAPRRARGRPHGRGKRVAGVPPGHGAAARTGPDRGPGDDGDQRAQGLRPGDRACTRVDAAERERDRARDVAHRFRWCERLRHRLGDRGVPVRARHPRAHAQHPPLQDGEQVTSVAAPAPAAAAEVPKVQESVAAKIMRWLAKAPVQILLIVIGLLWLVPTIGLFATSILPAQQLASKGWWQIFSKPSLATWSNYHALIHNHGMVNAFKTTAYIAVGNTLLVVVFGAMAGYAFAWLEFPGRDWIFIGVIGLLVVPLQMALIPMFRLYDTFSLYGTVWGIVLFHTAFGLPFAIFLLRNFFTGIPKDILESARIDGANEFVIFVRLILPLGLPAIASLAIFQFLWTWNDLIVSLTFGVQPDHGVDLRAAARVRDEHRRDRARGIHLAADSAGRLLRVSAVLRSGPAGRLGEVMAGVAVVGSGLAGFTAYQTLRRSLEPEEIVVFGTEDDPAAVWRRRAEAIRQREMRSESDGHCLPTSFPGLSFRSAVSSALAGADHRLGSRPLSPDGRGVPVPRRRAAGKERLGPEPAQIEGRPDPGGRRRFRARRRRSIPSRAGCAGASGSQRPGGAARRPADGSLVRAPRVRVDGDSGRCRPCGCDRVAERAGRGRRGRLGQAPRAAAAAAERAARVLLAPRARARSTGSDPASGRPG